MTRALVLRPEPGNRDTCARLAAAGVTAIAAPLFAVVPVAWEPPVGEFDALLLTSANAARHAGASLAQYATLPVVAIGAATAAAARTAGLRVDEVGTGDVTAAVARAGGRRLLHLAGRHRRTVPGITAVTVYESVALPLAPDTLVVAKDGVALLHSARAARRFAALLPAEARSALSLAALSPAIADAAGPGWYGIASVPQPRDALLVALAADIIDRSRAGADKSAS